MLCDEPRVRAQFSAVRERAFEKLRRPSKIWKVLWYVPFNACAIVALSLDHAQGRLALQILSLVACVVVIVHFRPFARRMAPIGMAFGTLHYVVGVANTGGLSSPLLLAGLPMLAMAGIVLEGRRERGIFTGFVALSFLVLAAGSATALVLRPAMLFAEKGATITHCVFAGITCVMATMALIHIGAGITRAYTEVVYDLAARHEEITEEGEELGRSLEGWAARVAHEVKNPLASIKALSTLEAKRATDPKTAERLAVIATEADRLRDVVDGFLSFRKQAIALKLGEVKPHDIAHEIAVLLEGRSTETGVALEVCGDESLAIVADGRKLRQALLNLVLNAVQASAKGTIVRLAVDRQCDQARIRVIDHGEGMSADVLERIRRPHFSTKQGGSGLGLAVARSLIQQHGGELEIASCKKGGTTATILLPLEPKTDGLASQGGVTSMQWLASS